MKRMFALVLALVMVISLMPGIFVTAQNTDRVTDLVNGMSLRDKVTQMMMSTSATGLPRTSPS